MTRRTVEIINALTFAAWAVLVVWLGTALARHWGW